MSKSIRFTVIPGKKYKLHIAVSNEEMKYCPMVVSGEDTPYMYWSCDANIPLVIHDMEITARDDTIIFCASDKDSNMCFHDGLPCTDIEAGKFVLSDAYVQRQLGIISVTRDYNWPAGCVTYNVPYWDEDQAIREKFKEELGEQND